MFKRFRAWRASKGTVRHAERLKLDEPLMPAGGSSQSGLFEQRLDISPDLFADLYPKEAEAQSYHDANYSDVDKYASHHVPTGR